MRVIALEEHMATPDVVEAWRRLEPRWQDVGFAHSTQGDVGRRLLELGPDRLAAMDAAGVDPQVSMMFAIGGIGWHYETGVQVIRLILSGVLDRFPRLQLILGRWGEVILFYLERIDAMREVAKLPRSFPEYIRDQVYVSPSGIFSQRYLRWAIEEVGIERILFSVDYPFQQVSDGGARSFLEAADVSEADRAQIAGGNWERLVAGIGHAGPPA